MLRLIVALLFSGLLHLLVMMGIYLYLEVKPNVILYQSKESMHIVLDGKVSQPLAQATSNNQSNISKNLNKINDSNLNAKGAVSSQTEPIFYSIKEIDRKALPQTSVNQEVLNPIPYSGLPIQLRLFVNATGHLVKIERIGVLAQDDFFVSELEQLLYQIPFLPARRHEMDVNSYQDAQFSFGQLPTLIEN